jgi:uncharacterized membrane protein
MAKQDKQRRIKMSWYTSTAFIHASIGTLALLTFWVAGLSKKGSVIHKAAGKIYLLAMTGIIISAFPLTISMLLNKNPAGGSFFLYLLVITTTSVWCSWRAIRDKRDWSRYVGKIFKFLMVLNLLSALAIVSVAVMIPNDIQIILMAFSIIGIMNAVKMFRFSRKAPADPRWWLEQHLGSMIGNGVATHIAFLSVGLPRVLPMLSGPVLQNLAWLGPLTLSFVAAIYLTRKYLPKKPQTL